MPLRTLPSLEQLLWEQQQKQNFSHVFHQWTWIRLKEMKIRMAQVKMICIALVLIFEETYGLGKKRGKTGTSQHNTAATTLSCELTCFFAGFCCGAAPWAGAARPTRLITTRLQSVVLNLDTGSLLNKSIAQIWINKSYYLQHKNYSHVNAKRIPMSHVATVDNKGPAAVSNQNKTSLSSTLLRFLRLDKLTQKAFH